MTGNIFLYLASVVTLLNAILIFWRKKKSPFKTMAIFFFGFIFMSLAFFLLALPNSFVYNANGIQIIFILSDLFFLAVETCFSLTFLVTSGFSDYGKLFAAGAIGWMAVYLILAALFYSPAQPLLQDGNVFYWAAGTPWLQGINRILLVVGALTFAVAYFYWAGKVEEKRSLLKAAFFGMSMVVTATGGMIFWFFPFFHFTPFLLDLSTGLNFFGIVITVALVEFFRILRKIEMQNEKI